MTGESRAGSSSMKWVFGYLLCVIAGVAGSVLTVVFHQVVFVWLRFGQGVGTFFWSFYVVLPVLAFVLGLLLAPRQGQSMLGRSLLANPSLYLGGCFAISTLPSLDSTFWFDYLAELVPWGIICGAGWAPTLVGMWLRRRWRSGRFTEPMACPKCGYNLTGNVSGRGPECGRPVERATAGLSG